MLAVLVVPHSPSTLSTFISSRLSLPSSSFGSTESAKSGVRTISRPSYSSGVDNSLIAEDPNAAEVVKISSGQLFLTRAGILRSNRECIYNEAMATIRRIPQMDHNFQLVITRVYEDEDQGLLAEDDETDEERVFLVGEELDFRPGVTDGEPTFDHSGIVTAQIVRGGSGYDYYLSAATSDDHLLLHKIASELNQRCSKKIRTLKWNHTGDNGVGHSWLFRFENDEDYQAFTSTFMSCLWETTNQTSWAKIKADEQDYVMRSANDEDVEMKDVEDSDEDEDAVQSALDPDEEPSDDEEEDEVHLERPPRRHTNAPTRAFFETCMYRAMFERKYKRSADMASEAALDESVYKPPPPKATRLQISSRKASPSTSKISSAPVPSPQEPQAEPEPIAEETAMSVEPSAPRESLGLTPTPLPNAETIHSLTLQVGTIAIATTAVARGDLTQKIGGVFVSGEMLSLVSTINDMIDQLATFAAEVKKVAREVGAEGKLGVQAEVGNVQRIWQEITLTVPFAQTFCEHDGWTLDGTLRTPNSRVGRPCAAPEQGRTCNEEKDKNGAFDGGGWGGI
ncbi:hypothetical protein D9611_009728 [Ephemerocybe angulata]|uniref:HAMP domain-containing protein n=1 Tax=Ephemerocybe angulata TaxID=980116 RepID=A0A8H5FGM3_9AGAR|nr:hypothetical protein D9611_009728 [Tulosesus angulatus]